MFICLYHLHCRIKITKQLLYYTFQTMWRLSFGIFNGAYLLHLNSFIELLHLNLNNESFKITTKTVKLVWQCLILLIVCLLYPTSLSDSGAIYLYLHVRTIHRYFYYIMSHLPYLRLRNHTGVKFFNIVF